MDVVQGHILVGPTKLETKRYVACRFQGQMIFDGTASPVFDSCTFAEDTFFDITGPALNTLRFLAEMKAHRLARPNFEDLLKRLLPAGAGFKKRAS